MPELSQLAQAVIEVGFDEIDRMTKYAAAALSYDRSRFDWWTGYQMHPLVQRRRRVVLQRALRSHASKVDALLMWGSWFHPFGNSSTFQLPYFNYIDQSCSLNPEPDEPSAPERLRRRSHALQAETYRDSSGVLCWSEWARAQTLRSHAISEEKIHVVGWGPCGVDLSAENMPLTKREPLVLHVSNNFYRKGVDFLLETARIVGETEPNARFVVVGKDCAAMRLEDTWNVTFVGPLGDADALAEYFRRASVFFLPHRFDRSPHVLVEAMSAGLPVVTSFQGGSVELVRGNGAGECVPVGDVGAYARAIVSLLRDPDARHQIGERGRTAVRRTYNWRSVAARIVDVVTGTMQRVGAQAHS